MFEIVTPHLFRTQIHTLRQTLPACSTASGSIHDARIATRRSAKSPVAWRSKTPEAHRRASFAFKRLGKSLGRVRDADVRIALLASLETRMPHTARSLVVLRQQRGRTLELFEARERLERTEAVQLIETSTAVA